MWYLYTLLYCTLWVLWMTFVVSSMWYLLACKLACQNKQPRCHTWLFSPLVFTSKNNTFYIHFLDIELKTLGFGTHQPCNTCSPLHDMCSFFRNKTTKSIDCLIDKCLFPGPGFFFRNKTTKVIDCLIDQCLLPGPGFFFRNNTTKVIDCLIDQCLLPGPGFFFRNNTTKSIDCLIDQCLLPGPGFFSWAWMFEQWIFLCRGRWWGPGGCRKILHTYRVSAGLCPSLQGIKTSTTPSFKVAVSRDFWAFFLHASKSPGPLINGLKRFCWKICFRGDIRFFFTS